MRTRFKSGVAAIYAPRDWQDWLFADTTPGRLRRLLGELLSVGPDPVALARAAHVHVLLGDPGAGIQLLKAYCGPPPPIMAGQLALCHAARLRHDDVLAVLNGPRLLRPVTDSLGMEGQWRLDYALGIVWAERENAEQMRAHYERAAHLAALTDCDTVARSARIDLLQHLHPLQPVQSRAGLLDLMAEADAAGHEAHRQHAARQVANVLVTVGEYEALHDFAGRYMTGEEQRVLCEGTAMLLGRPYELPPLGTWKRHSFEVAMHSLHTLSRARESARLWQVKHARVLAENVLELPDPDPARLWPGAVQLIDLARASALLLLGRSSDAQRVAAGMRNVPEVASHVRLLRAGLMLEALTLPGASDFPGYSGAEALTDVGFMFMNLGESARVRGAHLFVKWTPDAAAILARSPLAVPEVTDLLRNGAVFLSGSGATFRGQLVPSYPRMGARSAMLATLEAALTAVPSLSEADYKRLQRHRKALLGLPDAGLRGMSVGVPPVVRCWTIDGALKILVQRMPGAMRAKWTAHLHDTEPLHSTA